MPANNRAERAEEYRNRFDAEFEVEDDPDTYESATHWDCSPICIE